MEIMTDPGSVPRIDPAIWIVCMNLLSNLLYNTKHNANRHEMLDLKCFQMHAVKKVRNAPRGPKRTGAGIQGGEKSSYGGPRAYDNSLWPGTSFLWPHVGQNVPGLGHRVGDPNKGVTSKGHTISYRKNQRKFWFHKKEGSKNIISLSALALGRGERKKDFLSPKNL